MGENKYRVAIVGSGFIGALHANAWNNLDCAEIVAICDVKKIKAKTGAKKYGVKDQKWYIDVNEMLADTENPIDIIDICVPTPFHIDILKVAAKAKKHCVIEKPLARTVEQADEMIEITKQNGITAFPAHVMRFAAPWLRVKALIEEGKIGDLKELEFYRVTGAPAWGPWFFDEQISGGIFLDLIIHDIDLSCFFVNSKVKEMKSEGFKKEESTHNTWDAGNVHISFENGVISKCFGSWIAPNYINNGSLETATKLNNMNESVSMKAIGTVGTLEWDGLDSILFNNEVFESGFKDFALDLYQKELQNFLNHLSKDEPLKITLEEGKNAVALALQALELSKK